MNAIQPFVPPSYTFEDELTVKRQFAECLLKFGEANVWKAALAVTGPNVPNQTLFVAQTWVNDKTVLDIKKELLEEFGEEHFLPTKAELARTVWDRANSASLDEDFAKLMKLYAEIRGYVEKPQASVVNNNNLIAPKVMVIENKGSDDEWATGLLHNQSKLTSDSVIEGTINDSEESD